METITPEQAIDYLEVGCRVMNIKATKKELDQVVKLYNLIVKKNGEVGLKEVIEISLSTIK